MLDMNHHTLAEVEEDVCVKYRRILKNDPILSALLDGTMSFATAADEEIRLRKADEALMAEKDKICQVYNSPQGGSNQKKSTHRHRQSASKSGAKSTKRGGQSG